MIGETVLHYKILEKLGAGGMGAVYLAQDTKLNRQVAIKFLPADQAADPDARQRFLHEAKAQALISHPNIASFHDVQEHEGQALIVMEYVEGRSLSEVVQTDKLTLPEILDYVVQVGEGLQAAHEKGVVHRDVKPANVLVTAKGHVKILDFGLARWRDATVITKTGTRMGTAMYMSPEQAEGRKVDHRSDIFSLGVMLYELVCARRPFEGDSDPAVLYDILNTEPQPLARYSRRTPDELQRIVSKCLAKRPDERYQSVSDLVADLRRLKRDLESGVTPGVSASVAKGGRKRLSYALAGAGILVVAVLLVVVNPFQWKLVQDRGAIAADDSIAVLYFDNLAEPDDPRKLGEIASNLLITDLSEARGLDVVSDQRLYDILKQLGYEGVKRIDRDVASQVARRARTKWMLQGTILQVEPRLIITAQIVETTTGKMLASQRAEGMSDEGVFAVVDRLSRDVRADLTLPESAQPQVDPKLANVTTSSDDAYRLYLEGMELSFQHQYAPAAERFRDAVAIDSTFAVAYFRWSQVTRDYVEMVRLAELALRFADHASPRERERIRCYHAQAADYEPRKALELTQAFLREYPNEHEALMGVYEAYGALEQADSALWALEELVEKDPLYKEAYNKLAYEYLKVDDLQRSIWAINEYIELAPDEPNPYDTRADLYAFQGQHTEARRGYGEVLAKDADFKDSRIKLAWMMVIEEDFDSAAHQFQVATNTTRPHPKTRARYGLAAIAVYRGQLRRALELLDQGIAANALDGLVNETSFNYWTKMRILEELDDPQAADAVLDEALRSLDTTHPAMMGQALLVKTSLCAHSDRLKEARDAAEQLKQLARRTSGPGSEESWPMYHLALGDIALSAGDHDAAISRFERVLKQWTSFSSLYAVGRSYLAAGQISGAVDALSRAAVRLDETHFLSAIDQVSVLYYLGQAYEQSGWADKAIEQYEKFLYVWREADPGLAIVDDAQRRLAALKS